MSGPNVNDIESLRDRLRDAINNYNGEARLVDISEAIAYTLIDIGSTAAKAGEITPEVLKELYSIHQKRPTLAVALILQGASMLGWLRDEELVSSSLITRQKLT